MAGEVTRKNGCKTGLMKQAIFALIVAAAKVEVGLVVGWPAVLPKMEADNTTRFDVSGNDVKWLVSIPGIGGLALTPFTGLLMELMGPRTLLVVALLPAGFAFLLKAFTPFLSLLYLGRVFTCITLSTLGPVVSVLITEMCEPQIRGFLLCVEEITIAVGQMLIYVMAQYLPWDVATAVCAAPILLFSVLSFLLPESPYWLVRRDQKEAALQSLRKLRDPMHNVNQELLEITNSAQEHPQSTIKYQLKQLAQPQNYRPVLLLTAVFVLREFGGEYVIFSYAVYLFRKAGVSLDAFTCTVLVGAVRIVFTFIAAVVVDRVGRRPLLIGTTIICGVAEVIGAIFLLVDAPGSSWVPVAAILVFVSSYGLGIGPIPWALMGELIPTPVRSIGSSLCNFSFTLTVFVVSFFFPLLLEAGLGVALLVFASAQLIMMLLLCLYMPETRGRSLTELQEIFIPKVQNA